MSQVEIAKSAQTNREAASAARLLVVMLAFAWGLNWIAAEFALRDVPPWSLRFAGIFIGLLTLCTAALLTGHDLRVPRGERRHVMVAGFCNAGAFQMLSVFAQLDGATSRAIIIAYSMPIWAAVLSWLLMRERLSAMRWLALALCVIGLAILMAPQLAAGVPRAVLEALGCALSWAFATVYIKWKKVTAPPLANAAWQMMFGSILITAGTFIFDGYPRLWPIHTVPLLGLIYTGVFGFGLAHFLWWSIVSKLPAVTASIGSLLVPVIGVTASALILGEHLTLPDIIGFAFIFAAAATVLLQPNTKFKEMPD